jgi:Tol biopolymer transport system component/DNA-binding winged helix-turn-helix (wHTH) protein
MIAEPGPSTSVVFRFGPFEFYPSAGELRKSGLRIKLRGQPVEILSMLLATPAAVVTREDLKARLWPQDTFVDFENSLNAAVKRLRAALGDSAQEPRYVETLARRGYRFIAPVEAVPRGQAPVPPLLPIEIANNSQASAPRRAWKPAVAVFAAGAAAVAAWLGIYLLDPLPPPRALRIERLSNSGRVDPYARVVTDGTRVYFIERAGSHWNLMQTSIDGGEPQRVAAPFDNTRVFDISPGGTQLLIGSFEARTSENPLWTWPSQGGPARRVGDVMAKSAIWSPDGQYVVYAHAQSIYRADLDGSHIRELVRTAATPGELALSPDRTTLRFSLFISESGKDLVQVWQAGVDGGRLSRVLPNWGREPNVHAGGWSANGNYFLFSAGSFEKSTVWAQRAQGSFWRRANQSPVQVTQGPDGFWVPVATRSGSKALIFSGHSETSVTRYDPATRRSDALLPGINAVSLDVSRDGEWVAYVARDLTLWRCRTDGSLRMQLTFPPERVTEPRWSPDGSQIAVLASGPGVSTFAALVSAEGGAAKPLLRARGSYRSDWAPDSRAIVVQAADSNKPAEYSLYRDDLKSGNLTVLADSRGMTFPRWSPDGRLIAALAQDARRLFVFDLKAKAWTTLAGGNLLSNPRWSADSSYLYYQDLLEAEQAVYRIRVRDRRSRKLMGFGKELREGAQRCWFAALGPERGSLIVLLDRGWIDVYALDLDLP